MHTVSHYLPYAIRKFLKLFKKLVYVKRVHSWCVIWSQAAPTYPYGITVRRRGSGTGGPDRRGCESQGGGSGRGGAEPEENFWRFRTLSFNQKRIRRAAA